MTPVTGQPPVPEIVEHVAPPSEGLAMTWRVGILLALAAGCTVVAFSGPPLRDSIQYFDFADARRLAGIPNGMNVLSSGAFILAGLAGVAAILGGRATFRDPRERAPWLIFFSGVAIAGLGTGSFHLAPSSGTLALDRVPMTLGFTGLLAALVTERIDVAWGRRLLWPVVVSGFASIAWWYVTDRAGAADLRPYMVLQFFPLLAIPFLLLAFPSPYSGSGLYLVALGAYVLGKVAEARDQAIFRFGELVSGHSLKHVVAAAAVGVVVWMLVTRKPVEGSRCTTS